MMKGWWRDMRYAARSFRRAPAFSAVAIGTLALAMAAAIAIFSLNNGVLMRPLAAERHFGEDDPIGRTLTVRGVGRTVVGVAEDATEFSVSDERKPVLYTPYAQETQAAWMRNTMQLVARGDPPRQVAAAIRAAARAVHTAACDPRPLQALVARDIAAPRFRATMFALFAAPALALSAVGIGGVIAYGVSERLPELGLRLALGAAPAALVQLVVAQSARPALAGAALGVLATYPLAHLVAGLLYGVPATDPLTLAAGACGPAAAPTLLFAGGESENPHGRRVREGFCAPGALCACGRRLRLSRASARSPARSCSGPGSAGSSRCPGSHP